VEPDQQKVRQIALDTRSRSMWRRQTSLVPRLAVGLVTTASGYSGPPMTVTSGTSKREGGIISDTPRRTDQACCLPACHLDGRRSRPVSRPRNDGRS
jgi:hypothetical protein